MAELKTKQTDESVEAFLNGILDEKRRQECFTVLEMMKQATDEEPKMWGSSIVGLGDYHYKYASGREGDYFITGFSPRKQNLTLYVMGGFEQQGELLSRLGKHSLGKGCLYIKKLEDVDLPTLQELVTSSVEYAHKMNADTA